MSGTQKRLTLLGILITILTVAFWTQSRYPALDEKALMGGETPIQGIAFDEVLKVSPDQIWTSRITYSFVNWLETNKKGMVFGILFATCLLSALPLIASRQPKGVFGNTLLGVAIGAPLGICVNCAAPVAGGMRAGGARLETALATMISSPTMNVVVLTMMFTMLPWYFGAVKILSTAILLFVAIPLLCRFVFKAEGNAVDSSGKSLRPGPEACSSNACEDLPASWMASFKWTCQQLVKNLWFLVRKTGPLMLLAGFLGAVLVTFVPIADLEDWLPLSGSGWLILGFVGTLAFVGTFLPVPMAFDVIVVAILAAAGVRTDFCVALLFTLGSFSIYSSFVVTRAASLRVATTLFAVVVCGGIASGLVARAIEKPYLAHQHEILLEHYADAVPAPRPQKPALTPALSEAALNTVLSDSQLESESVTNMELPTGLTISRIPDSHQTSPFEGRFVRHDGRDLGIDSPWVYTVRKMVMRTDRWRPLAAGDLHGDGWPDLVMNADPEIGGLMIFANDGGKRFVRQDISVGDLESSLIANVSLVDLDNDGWLDIVFSTFNRGVFFYRSDEGRFLPDNISFLTKRESSTAYSIGFGDFDRNGELDVVLGNWTAWHSFADAAPEAMRNQLLMQHNGQFTEQELPGQPGYSLSVLCSDWNQDGLLDVAIANDFTPPDSFYHGDGNGGFSHVKRSQNAIPVTPMNSMSIATADTNNDLKFEMLICGISWGGWDRKMERTVPWDEVSFEYERANEQRQYEEQNLQHALYNRQLKQPAPADVLGIEPPWLRDDLLYNCAVRLAWKDPSGHHVPVIPDAAVHEQEFARRTLGLPPYVPTPTERAAAIRQDTPDNVFLVPRTNGESGFENLAADSGLAHSDWTWNAKFADFDNDGWQDLYTVNGWQRHAWRDTNHYFHNTHSAASRFEERTEEIGLQDYLPTSASTYLDYDNDGDLDIITLPVNGPPRVFENRFATGQQLNIELRDHIGNHYGIGSKVTIRCSDGQRQIREIQPGGGHLSTNPAIAHFGLGENEIVDEIVIEWSTGETTALQGVFEAGHRYQVERN